MIFEYIRTFFLIYVIAIAAMLVASSRLSGPIVFPGDIYFRRGGRTFYFPLGSSFVLALVLFLLFRAIVTPFTRSKAIPTNSVNLIR